MTQAAGRTPGLERLRVRFGLDAFEVDTLLHAVAPTLDPSLPRLSSRLTGANFRSWVDVGFVIQVHFCGVAERLRARARFGPGAPLLEHRLIALDCSRPD